ncbi:NUDIX domain-containing protein [Sandaracinus amylolyticus]|uniref:5-methyl-dCTP pyrophosphohydrolase n=1 Tax=Sandaracinus amylolyticus TaxID=927083 RepID=A0A0F6YHS5_9BACT|nr:NUDIX domain-containing protein [Sandaracinus amylolyticus]AKF05057.1 5-methyl-dCTP pyrophosphohydrolase [Sandaracinus amylolyticus]
MRDPMSIARAEEKDAFVVAVVAVIVRDDPDGARRVLAMRRAATKDAGAGIWETCSGRLEADEQPIDAVTREVREETGLEVRVDATPIDAYAMRRRERPMALIVYRAAWIAGEVRRSDEHDAHAWWTLAEVEASPMPTRLVEAVKRALAR